MPISNNFPAFLFLRKPTTPEYLEMLDNMRRVEPLPKSIGEQILETVIVQPLLSQLCGSSFTTGGEYVVRKPR